MTDREPSPYMTRQEVADFFGVDVMTVYAWGRRPDGLTAYKYGKRFVRYLRTEVENFLQPVHGEEQA